MGGRDICSSRDNAEAEQVLSLLSDTPIIPTVHCGHACCAVFRADSEPINNVQTQKFEAAHNQFHIKQTCKDTGGRWGAYVQECRQEGSSQYNNTQATLENLI